MNRKGAHFTGEARTEDTGVTEVFFCYGRRAPQADFRPQSRHESREARTEHKEVIQDFFLLLMNGSQAGPRQQCRNESHFQNLPFRTSVSSV